jgi:hypothetical protein
MSTLTNFNDIKLIKSFNLIYQLLSLINININSPEQLLNLSIDRTTLCEPTLINQFLTFKEKMKGLFHSSYLTCLHDNSQQKQKYPAINMLRQLLKCLGYKLKPTIINLGYNKTTGKKIIKRTFTIYLI